MVVNMYLQYFNLIRLNLQAAKNLELNFPIFDTKMLLAER